GLSVTRPAVLSAALPVVFCLALAPLTAEARPAGAPPATSFDRMAPMDTVRKLLAAPAGFRSQDFDLMVNYRGHIPRAPSVVISLLRAPARADSLMPALRRSLTPRFKGGRSLASQGAISSSDGAAPYALVPSTALWPWLDVVVPPRPGG